MRSDYDYYKDMPRLHAILQTQYVGRAILWFRSLSSTQELAKELVNEKGALRVGGYVIIADSQLSGTGRNGRKWASPRGGIWLSVILSSKLHPSKCISFSFGASLAVSEAINHCTGLESKLKWPNDILIDGKKVSGVLVDASVNSSSIEYVIVGIGVNVNVNSAEVQRDIKCRTFPYQVTSLSDELAARCEKVRLIKNILQTLDKYYLKIESDTDYPLLEQWKHRAIDITSKPVYVSHGAEGFTATVLGLEEDGSLVVVRDNNRIERIVSAEYSIRFIT
jgi:BirA family transcriptional regulator, biotin operon repressor / biotin---[acetyl-CoA-carboxylase] ligase